MDRACYPHTKPGPGESPWINVTLYAIAGWMSSWYPSGELCKIEELATAFGGYFRILDDGRLEGELIDTFGNAEIEGKLTARELVFTKTYIHRTHFSSARGPINYCFKKDQSMWKGGFTLADGTRGRAECSISAAIQDAHGIVAGPLRK